MENQGSTTPIENPVSQATIAQADAVLESPDFKTQLERFYQVVVPQQTETSMQAQQFVR